MSQTGDGEGLHSIQVVGERNCTTWKMQRYTGIGSPPRRRQFSVHQCRWHKRHTYACTRTHTPRCIWWAMQSRAVTLWLHITLQTAYCHSEAESLSGRLLSKQSFSWIRRATWQFAFCFGGFLLSRVLCSFFSCYSLWPSAHWFANLCLFSSASSQSPCSRMNSVAREEKAPPVENCLFCFLRLFSLSALW